MNKQSLSDYHDYLYIITFAGDILCFTKLALLIIQD